MSKWEAWIGIQLQHLPHLIPGGAWLFIIVQIEKNDCPDWIVHIEKSQIHWPAVVYRLHFLDKEGSLWLMKVPTRLICKLSTSIQTPLAFKHPSIWANESKDGFEHPCRGWTTFCKINFHYLFATMASNRRGYFQCLSYYDTFYTPGQRINANFLPTNKYIHTNINSKMKKIITVLSIDQMEPLYFRFWLGIHSLSFLYSGRYNLLCHHLPVSLTSKSQGHLNTLRSIISWHCSFPCIFIHELMTIDSFGGLRNHSRIYCIFLGNSRPITLETFQLIDQFNDILLFPSGKTKVLMRGKHHFRIPMTKLLFSASEYLLLFFF